MSHEFNKMLGKSDVCSRSKRFRWPMSVKRAAEIVLPRFLLVEDVTFGNDEYANHIPNPKHMPKYTKAKVPGTQDKHTQLSSFSELCCHCC